MHRLSVVDGVARVPGNVAIASRMRHDPPPMSERTVQPIPPGFSYQLAGLARRPGLTVFVCADLRRYRQLSEELGFYLQDAPGRLWRFPAWETLPYDRSSPHHAIVGERFATLGRLLREPDAQGLVLTALPAWLQRIAPPEAIATHVWQLAVGDAMDLGALVRRLAEGGMQAVERVLGRGEFAARGGLLDIWPAAEEQPLRIDLFGDEVESIRRFDIENQRSGESMERFTSVPVREVILDEAGRERFAAAFRERFPQLRKHPMLAAVQAGRPHPGIESLLPLAYEATARLTDYLPDGCRCLADTGIDQAREAFAAQVRAQFELMRLSQEPVISPQELYAVETALGTRDIDAPVLAAAPALDDFRERAQPLHALLATLKDRLDQGWRLLLVAHGPGQQERMCETCQPLIGTTSSGNNPEEIPVIHGWPQAPAPVQSTIGYLDAGFALEDERLLVLTGRELLGQRLPRRQHRRSTVRADVFNSLQELKIGDPVVHEDHGVGRYRGLSTMDIDGVAADFLHIEYANEASIHLPVEELDRLHRYTGEEQPSLNRLGSEQWRKTRERVRRDLLDMAHELVDTEAARQQSARAPYALDGDLLEAYEEFAARFPFEETDDQAEAIRQVLGDLQRERPMDRVICGDVGFGKTEVAMRAAFVVARAGRQVALLAPTTVLANQHYASLSDRFAGTGLAIEMLSRVQGKKETDRIRRELANGAIRILVGTHRMLASEFAFADLGLVIIDEEQRFGVKDKERLKALHHAADVLTLTATPIPRTLHQTLSGLRDISIISTPPAEREAIRTVVTTFDEQLAVEAIRREMYRGGQVYYMHNHVQSIERITRRLGELLPEAEIGIAHGQMGAAQLDRRMLDFYEGRLHILVCTTIVESGLDVPNANTLIVERADLLGLSQLHQIRGRVGRSHQQAYAYLFAPDARAMTPDARERLAAIAEYTELGAGFMLARQDMEIRGAGNLLGAQQSGQIEAIGLDLYMEMLHEAVAEARGKRPEPPQPLDLHLAVNAILPPDYIPQIGERLSLYRRIARAADDAQVGLLFEEMTDRFGRMPPEARFCLETARLRWRARKLRLSRLDAPASGIRLLFTEDSPIDRMKLLARVQADPRHHALRPDGSLTLLGDWADAGARLAHTVAFLDALLKD
jgi:transcription-repair coupling factor (superfamily II helicase)